MQLGSPTPSTPARTTQAGPSTEPADHEIATSQRPREATRIVEPAHARLASRAFSGMKTAITEAED